jgi:hypothetical protein
MATATYTQFIAAIQALSVTNVKRKYTEPPQAFNETDLPCSFVMFPSGDNTPLSFTGGRQFRNRSVDFIVVYADTAPTVDAPFSATVTMMDNVETALTGLSVGRSDPTWEIRSQLYRETAGRLYWAVIATIRGTG